jgi:hybrid cluster-associated redox disulfide protein
MAQSRLKADLIVADVLACWPQTIPVFTRLRMGCVGCAMAPFETLVDVSAIYGLDLNYFLSELEQAISQTKKQA